MTHPTRDIREHFGFTPIAPEQKADKVKEVFASVAGKYDLMNDVMSGGLHRLWKNHMVRTLAPWPGRDYLDVAGGTGDIAFRIQDAMQQRLQHLHQPPEATGSITVCDINEAMLREGEARSRNQLRPWKQAVPLQWLCGNAEKLPLPDASYDGYTIAFGIRNVTDIQQALREAYRVLKPGGQFLCLEFSPDIKPALKPVYDAYSFQLIPRFGKWLTGDKGAYDYLVESIRLFPRAERFKQMMQEAGFSRVSYHYHTGGIVALHRGWKVA